MKASVSEHSQFFVVFFFASLFKVAKTFARHLHTVFLVLSILNMFKIFVRLHFCYLERTLAKKQDSEHAPTRANVHLSVTNRLN